MDDRLIILLSFVDDLVKAQRAIRFANYAAIREERQKEAEKAKVNLSNGIVELYIDLRFTEEKIKQMEGK